MNDNIVVADIGGTNARLACLHRGELTKFATYPTRSIRNLNTLIANYLEENSLNINACVFSVAGQVSQNGVRLTNVDLHVDARQLKADFGLHSVRVLNDFEAIAWACTSPEISDIRKIRHVNNHPKGNKLIVGPGTGLGISAVLHADNSLPCIHRCEGGHIGHAPRNDFEREVFLNLAALWPETKFHTSDALEAEALISGTGFPLLYRAVCTVLGVACVHRSAGAILREASAIADGAAAVASQVFKQHLGMLVTNLALVFNAQGGIFFAGGVARNNPWIFDEAFIALINGSSRYDDFFDGINIVLLESDHIGLQGAAAYAGSNVLPRELI